MGRPIECVSYESTELACIWSICNTQPRQCVFWRAREMGLLCVQNTIEQLACHIIEILNNNPQAIKQISMGKKPEKAIQFLLGKIMRIWPGAWAEEVLGFIQGYLGLKFE